MEVVGEIWVARARGQGREVELCLLDAHVLCSRFSSWAVFGIVRHVFFSFAEIKTALVDGKETDGTGFAFAAVMKGLKALVRKKQLGHKGTGRSSGMCLVLKEMYPVGFWGVCTVICLTYSDEKSSHRRHHEEVGFNSWDGIRKLGGERTVPGTSGFKGTQTNQKKRSWTVGKFYG